MGWQDVLRAAQQAPLDVAAVDDVIDGLWPGARLGDATPMDGGLSSVLHVLRLRGAPVDRVVLRQLLEEFGDDAETVRREAAAHRGLAPTAVPVPDVLWADPGGTTFGRPALLLAFVPGEPLLPGLATDAGRTAFAAAVASLHAVDAAAVPGLDRLTDVHAHADRFGPPATSSTVIDDDALARASREVAAAFVPREQVVHCDLHAGNVLWDGTVVTGILDWPGAAIGVGLADEAYAILDTTLAMGREAGQRLAAALDEVRPGPDPGEAERRLWQAVALRRAMPSPRPWAEVYRASGVDVSDDAGERRWVRLVDDFLGEA